MATKINMLNGGRLRPMNGSTINILSDGSGMYYDEVNEKWYHYVTIGTQQWMVENLDANKYNDGTKIPEIGNQSDWYLPSNGELSQMHLNLKSYSIGNLENNNYQSSSEADSSNSYYFNFGFGNILSGGKHLSRRVRSICHFNGTIGSYSLRDRGPAGGWIFYIDEYSETNATYYEAAPYDQSTGTAWSNVTNVAVGTTGTAIGDGEGNTYDITHQEGHTSSAAKLCEDLTSNEIWAADTTGARCWYNNDAETHEEYGQLYNWYAVNTGKLAPEGWRVPTDADFTTLSTYLGGNSVAGGKLKETGTTHWASPNTGATNETGFTALPGGYRANVGAFYYIGDYGRWWSATGYSTNNAWSQYMYYGSSNVSKSNGSKKLGFSVRCVRDVS